MGRSPCCEKSHTNKGAWTKEEDHRLIHYIRIHGEGSWRSLPEAAGLLRCGKSCRLRWMNYLRPDLKRGNFSDDEDQLIIKLHTLFGNKWSLIAGRLPGRTDNEIKNYWNTHIKRKLASHGIDPQTHRPLNETAFKNEPRASKTPSLVFEYNEFEVKAKSECIEEGYSTSSDMTTDEEQLQSNRHGLNLELSIGISSAGKRANSAESEPKVDNNSDYQFVGQAMLTNPKVVCLCWQLGFQRSEICRNCEICRPLGS